MAELASVPLVDGVQNTQMGNNARSGTTQQQEQDPAVIISQQAAVASAGRSTPGSYTSDNSSHWKDLLDHIAAFSARETNKFKGILPGDDPQAKARTAEVFVIAVFPDGKIKRASTPLFTTEASLLQQILANWAKSLVKLQATIICQLSSLLLPWEKSALCRRQLGLRRITLLPSLRLKMMVLKKWQQL